MNENKIGIIGGVGPYAGLDLFKKIFKLTAATTDQEHLDVALISYPGQITDRTGYLLGEVDESPAMGLMDVVERLDACGANILGLPCNTSHASKIWQPLNEQIVTKFPHMRLVNMIDAVVEYIGTIHGKACKIGVLATTGTVTTDVYGAALVGGGLCPVYPDDDIQNDYVQRAIYDEVAGIKAQSDPVTAAAREWLQSAMRHLIRKGAEAIILGCTELPLAFDEDSYRDAPLYDSSLILAKELVILAAPDKLIENR